MIFELLKEIRIILLDQNSVFMLNISLCIVQLVVGSGNRNHQQFHIKKFLLRKRGRPCPSDRNIRLKIKATNLLLTHKSQSLHIWKIRKKLSEVLVQFSKDDRKVHFCKFWSCLQHFCKGLIEVF